MSNPSTSPVFKDLLKYKTIDSVYLQDSSRSVQLENQSALLSRHMQCGVNTAYQQLAHRSQGPNRSLSRIYTLLSAEGSMHGASTPQLARWRRRRIECQCSATSPCARFPPHPTADRLAAGRSHRALARPHRCMVSAEIVGPLPPRRQPQAAGAA